MLTYTKNVFLSKWKAALSSTSVAGQQQREKHLFTQYGVIYVHNRIYLKTPPPPPEIPHCCVAQVGLKLP